MFTRSAVMAALGAMMLGWAGTAPVEAHDVKAMGATTCGQSTCHSADIP